MLDDTYLNIIRAADEADREDLSLRIAIAFALSRSSADRATARNAAPGNPPCDAARRLGYWPTSRLRAPRNLLGFMTT